MFTGIDKYAFEREADRLLSEGKFREATILLEDNLAEQGITLAGRVIYARSLQAEKKYKEAKLQLLKVLSENPEFPAALELMGDISRADREFGVSQYYRARLKESMRFAQIARSFWDDLSQQVEALEDWETEDSIDRETMIKSINELLGKEAERIWPFETKTLAELFIKQGHIRKGLAVYSRLLEKETDNSEMNFRVADLLDSFIPTGDRIVTHKKNPQNAIE